MPREHLGERIQRLRWARGLTQRTLAERMGINRTTVQRWEMLETRPRRSRLLTLAMLLCVTVDELVRGTFS